VTHWSAPLLGNHVRVLGIPVSDSGVRRILSDADLQPHRQKMWLTSQDDEFRAKRDDVLHVYYDTPADEHIICLDEKTSIQALERRYPDLPMQPGVHVRREVEYIRHGTLCLMGAYDVRRGKLFGFTCPTHDGPTFVQLLDHVDACYPTGMDAYVTKPVRVVELLAAIEKVTRAAAPPAPEPATPPAPKDILDREAALEDVGEEHGLLRGDRVGSRVRGDGDASLRVGCRA
jgi:hypothetical protein